MVDIEALVKALPASSLEPNQVASIGGLVRAPEGRDWQDRIVLLEPPAGQRMPYIEPVRALDILLRGQGLAPADAQARARAAVARMRVGLGEDRWVRFFDHFEPESPECLSVPDFVAWLREMARQCDQPATGPQERGSDEPSTAELSLSPDIVDFIDRAARLAASTPMFRGPDNRDEPWSLETLPALPPPKAMIEFVSGAPWADIDGWGEGWKASDNPFMVWREAMRTVALDLERALGEPVYYFADLDSDTDDDDVRRFLVLHWCCTWKPDSPFVRNLLRVSGALDVEELKTALIDPASYAQPFKMNYSFPGLETLACRFEFLPVEARKTIAVVFLTPQARDVAQVLLAERMGAHAYIVAPQDLLTDKWIEQTTRFCRGWTAHYLHDRRLDDPIEVLAAVDQLCVIADEKTPGIGFDLKLCGPVEELLWLALDLGVEAAYFHVDRSGLMNPDSSLRQRGVPERVAAKRARRAAFTARLTAIRLGNDFGATGLWDDKGRSLKYDSLDLPFPLVRRIAAWQRAYDETLNPTDAHDGAWWERHEQETLAIASALQEAIGSQVKVRRGEGRAPVGGVAPEPGDKKAGALTEEEAVLAFAKAWNRLEPEGFLVLLAHDARYASQGCSRNWSARRRSPTTCAARCEWCAPTASTTLTHASGPKSGARQAASAEGPAHS